MERGIVSRRVVGPTGGYIVRRLKGIKRIRPGMKLTAKTVQDIYDVTRKNTPHNGEANIGRNGWTRIDLRQNNHIAYEPQQFTVEKTTKDAIRVRNGYVNLIWRDYKGVSGSDDFQEARDDVGRINGTDVKWSDGEFDPDSWSDEYTVTGNGAIWLIIQTDPGSAQWKIEHDASSGPAQPSSAADDEIWIRLAKVTYSASSSEITNLEQFHVGPVILFSRQGIPSSWTSQNELTGAMNEWHANNGTGVKFTRSNTVWDSSNNQWKIYSWSEWYDEDGRLIYVGNETLEDTVTRKFIDLSDTPSSYSGGTDQFVQAFGGSIGYRQSTNFADGHQHDA